MNARFFLLRRVWTMTLCVVVMIVVGGVDRAWAVGACVPAAEIVDALYSTGSGAGRNGIPADYKPPCRLPQGRIMSIQASETEDFRDNSVVNSGGYIGCGQLGPRYHENPTYKRGSSSPLNIRGAGNEVQNLLRAGEYLCYIQQTLNTTRCEVVAAAYNAGEGAVGNGLSASGGTQGDIEAIINNSSVTSSKKTEMREYVGCSCGGELYQKYTLATAPDRYCQPKGGGVGAVSDAELTLDKIANVGTGVIQALANVVGTAVVLFDDHLGPALLSLVMTVYSIMALWAIAKLLMPFGKPGNAGQTMNGLLSMTATVGVVSLILSNLSLLTSLVFFPLMSTMTQLGDLSSTNSCAANNTTALCTTARSQRLSGDTAADAKLLATQMSCTIEQAMQPLKQTLRVSMAVLKRQENDFGNTTSGVLDFLGGLDKTGITSAITGGTSEKTDSAMRLIIIASALPLAFMSATAILGVIATTAQAFWKIAFEFFKLAPAVAGFAFRPTRGILTTSVKAWISPVMTFAVIYSILGLSSTIVCNADLGSDGSSNTITLAKDSDEYLKGISEESTYNIGAEIRSQKAGEVVVPLFTKTVWITMAFFTVFINSSLRLAANMDWVGGGGLGDGLSKLVSNTLGNPDNAKAAYEKLMTGVSALKNSGLKASQEKEQKGGGNSNTQQTQTASQSTQDPDKAGDWKPSDEPSFNGQPASSSSGQNDVVPGPRKRTPVS